MSRFFLLFILFISFSAQAHYFTENKGQIEQSNVLYDLELSKAHLYFEKQGLTIQLLEATGDSHDKSKSLKAHAVRQQFIGSRFSEMEASSPSESYVNFLKGNDSRKWVQGVKKYERIQYKNIYPGIDIRYYNQEDQLKYDILIKPQADASLFRWKYEGAEKAYITESGDIEYLTSLGKVIEKRPFTYQEIVGKKVEVKSQYKLYADGSFGFEILQNYNHNQVLVIDPVLIFATYTGSTADNWGFTATYDSQGNMFTGGIVFGAGYPTTTGAYNTTFNGGEIDMSISKFNSTGTQLIYSTYLGGNEPDAPHSMIVDDQDRLIIFGTTSSYDYPTTSGCYDGSYNGGSYYLMDGIAYSNGSDIVVTKLNANGTGLAASTYLGGSDNDGLNTESNANKLHHNYADNARGEVMIDLAGNIYVASCTESNNFPTTSGAAFTSFGGGLLDGCAAKLNASLSSLTWSTYLGGSNNDAAYSVKVSSNGTAYVVGGTMSSNFQTTSGVINSSYKGGDVDGFLLSLSGASGSLIASTFLGTNKYDQAYFVELDDQQNVYVLGQTKGPYPILGTVYNNTGSAQFIHKLNPALTSTLFSTVFGSGTTSECNISPSAFLVDKCNKIYVSGWGGGLMASGSSTNGMPITGNAFQSSTDGEDFYFMVLDSDASALLYGTYFGGNNLHEHVDGGTSRFDKNGYIYQAVCAGCGGSNQFPTTPGVWSNDNNSFNCNLGAIKMRFDQSPVYAYASVQPDTFSCVVPFQASFSNTSINATSHTWQFGAGQGSSTLPNPTYTYTTPGNYTITYIASNPNACNLKDTVYLQIYIAAVTPPSASFTYVKDCEAKQVQCTSTSATGFVLHWDMGDGNTYGNVSSVSHTYSSAGSYTITLINENTQCQAADTFTQLITIKPDFQASLTAADPGVCLPAMTAFQANAGAQSYLWSFGDGQFLASLVPQASHSYAIEGQFLASVVVTDSNYCNVRDSAFVNIMTSDGSPISAHFNVIKNCSNQSVALQNNSTGLSSFTTSTWDFGNGFSQINNASTLNYVYGTYGDYEIVLTLEDTICAVIDTHSQTIEMHLVNVQANPSPAYGCKPLNTTFSTVSNGDYFQWNFDDGSVSNLQNPNHTFMQGGIYQVTVTAIDSQSCNIQAQDMTTITVGSGLPLVADFDVVQDPNCDISKINIINQSQGEISNYYWNFGDGSMLQNIISPSHVYSSPGNYTITLHLDDTLCNFQDDFSQSIYLKPPITFSIPEQSFLCHQDTLIFTTGLDTSLYDHLWSTGVTSANIDVVQSGSYMITVSDGPCIKIKSVQVEDAPLLDLGDTIPQCYISQTVTLDIGVEALTYLWYQGGETSKNIQAEQAGLYPFYIKDLYACEYIDTFLLVEASSVNNVYVPNTFTPDGDGLNDILYAVGEGMTNFEFRIFNRWGEQIFYTDDIQKGWDATFRGEIVPQGIYTYKVKYHNDCAGETLITQNGFVLVLR